MKKIVVINVAGLSFELFKNNPDLPALSGILKRGGRALPLRPVFPAVTCTVQATMTTGLLPSQHGIVANGLFDREMYEAHFWEQSSTLVCGERFWTSMKKKSPGLKVAMLFWQNSKYAPADIVVTPAPIHTEKGEMLLSCYTTPRELSAELEGRFGPFPLHRYWGPMTSIESSRWIVDATKHVIKSASPHITLVYLPHMDYSLQKFGPASGQAQADLKAVDQLIGELDESARSAGASVMVVSDYAIKDVRKSIDINREFRKRGLISVREIKGKEYIEIGDCKAFAMVDHQVAHIYINDPAARADVLAILKGHDVEILGDDAEKKTHAIDHPRSGDIVAIAPEGAWFSYYWWLDSAKAPGFAGTVDIHRKPGYDPLDLFFNPIKKTIEMDDTSLIKGSHGRPPRGANDMALLLADFPIGDLPSPCATDLPALIRRIVEV